MSRLRIGLLGPPRLQRASRRAVALPSGKPTALLAYLALRPGRPHARDVLAHLLWGENGDGHARHSVRQALTSVRRRVGPRSLIADGDTITVRAASVDVDAVTFERLAASTSAKDLARAAALYEGDLLEGLRIDEAGFEEWLVTERRRLRELAVTALARLLAHQTEAWDDESAVLTAGRLLVLDPLKELAHRTLMRLHARQGRREAAVQQYQECVAVLKRELGVEPDAETRALFTQVVQAPASLEWAAEPIEPARQTRRSPDSRAPMSTLGERKYATVLCADFGVDHDRPAMPTSRDALVEKLLEAVHHFDGFVTRVSRDRLVALFGAPQAQEDHAARACQAALRMQQAVPHGAAHGRRATTRLRVGLHSGEVVVQRAVPDLRVVYAGARDATQVATRIARLAGHGAVCLSAETLRLGRGSIHARPLAPVSRRSAPEPLQVYEVLGASHVSTRFRAAEGRGLSRFVGRESEMEQLGTALAQARRRHGEVVAVVGEPGVGKSRLVHELIWSERLAGCLALHAQAVSHGATTPHLPLVDLLRDYFHVESGDAQATIQDKVSTALRMLDPALTDLVRPMLWLLDALPRDDSFRRLEPSQRRRRAQDAVKRVLLRESQTQPLVLLFEDLHWIDGETQALLDELVDSLATAPLLLVVSYRPEYRHSWSGKTYYRQIRVDPLALPIAESLLDSLVGPAVQLVPLKRRLIEITDGNPLFLEESVRSLVETGVLTEDRGAYAVTRLVEQLRIPSTIQAILAARIDRLPPDDKRLLQAAAVIGKDVPTPLLLAVAEGSAEEIRSGLRRLQAAELLYETRFVPEPAHTFKHALTHEAAYDGLLAERRRVLHAAIVETVERLPADRLEEQIELLAHHAWHAESWDRAFRYLLRAADRATARSAYHATVVLLERGLVALRHLPEARETLEQAIDIRVSLRRVVRIIGDVLESHDHLQEALAIAQRLGDQRRIALVSAFLSEHFRLIGEPDRAIELGHAARVIADTLGDVDLVVLAAMGMGPALYARGDYEQARDLLREALTLCQRSTDVFRIGVVEVRHRKVSAPALYRFLTRCLVELGEVRQATALAEEAFRLAEGTDNAGQLAIACETLGRVYLQIDALERAIPVLERGLALCREWNNEALLPALAQHLGFAHARSGRFDEAIRLLREGIDRSGAIGQMMSQAPRVAWLAETYFLAGRFADAAQAAEQALSLAREHGERGTEAWIYRLLGEIAAATGPSRDRAAEHLGRALTLADQLHMRLLTAHCRLGLGKLSRRAADVEQARQHLTVAAADYADMHMRAGVATAEAELQALSASHQPTR